jgi:hypothetical protein
MAENGAAWTGEWAIERIQNAYDVTQVDLLEPQILRITRKDKAPFTTATIASPRVEVGAIEPFLNSPHNVDFIANIPRESFWTGGAIQLASDFDVAWGGFGDLLSSFSLPEVRQFVKKEFGFVLRGLSQHSKVLDITRVHDRLLLLHRESLTDVYVVLLNEYELTADHVRTARERYGPFTDILITNPNGRPTTAALQAAESMGASVYKWGEFLGRLNKR